GWGNVMQELVFNAHLAYKSGRVFTMYNYTYDRNTAVDYAPFGRTGLRPPRVPLSAFLGAGPIAGGSFPDPHSDHPPAVVDEFFDQVCPHPAIVNVTAFKNENGLAWGAAETILHQFNALLRDTNNNCVDLFGDGPRMQSVWPEILASPIVTAWRWSSLVESGVEHNSKHIHPTLRISPGDRSPLKGLLTLHLRRGDFKGHCNHLAKWSSHYNAFNVYPGLPDQRTPPMNPSEGVASTEATAFFQEHCFPAYDQIVRKVRAVRSDALAHGVTLDRMYVLTNGDRTWLEGLKRELRAADPHMWKSIGTSRDLELTEEQKFVSQAMDMLVATRAEVFIGNAWSSLTANVNMLRVAQHHPLNTIRFW
ncbi:hypothetical protein K488DRAFT_61691, partial [Vararia minispora EC-137]